MYVYVQCLHMYSDWLRIKTWDTERTPNTFNVLDCLAKMRTTFTCWHWNGHLQAALFGRERVRVRRWVLALPLSLSLSQPISELVLKITQSFAKPMPFCREMWERARQQQQHQRHHIKVTQISRPNLRVHTHIHMYALAYVCMCM